MAKPLEFDPKTLLPTDEERLLSGTVSHTDSILEALKLLEHLHEHKVLHTLLRLMQGGEGLAYMGLEVLNEPGAVRGIRNLLELVQVLGAIEPESLRMVSRALEDGLREGARRVASGQKAGVGELLSLARDPDVGLALGAVVGVLRGFGKSLREQADAGAVLPKPSHV